MMTEKELNEAWETLNKAGWKYLGCDFWEDPTTGVRHSTGIAIRILQGK